MSAKLGKVRPGETIFIDWDTFSSDDPAASITMTGLATTDIEIYKDNSLVQRASDNGYTLIDTDGTDVDGITGHHGIEIDLADNSDAGFYAAGSRYKVMISSVTVDAGVISFKAAEFEIGYDGALWDTTIATLASQTSFTLTAGSADNDAYNNWKAVVHDVASRVQMCIGYVSNYVGSTRTITLAADPGIFTMAATDNISLFPPDNLAAVTGSAVEKSSDGRLRVDAAEWNDVPLATTNPLPNAAADGAGGLPISDAGGLDLDTLLARLDVAVSTRNSVTPLTAAGVRSAIGMSAADLDAQLAAIAGYIDTEVATLLTRIGTPADTDIATDIANILTGALTESYAANGVAPTLTQAVFAIHQMLMQFAISGTSITVKRLDNSTTAFVVTLNDASDPSSAERQ